MTDEDMHTIAVDADPENADWIKYQHCIDRRPLDQRRVPCAEFRRRCPTCHLAHDPLGQPSEKG